MTPRVDEIAAAVAAWFDLPLAEIQRKGRSRTTLAARARYVAFEVARRLTGHSVASIAAWWELDHSSVAHARARIRDDAELAAAADAVEERLRAGLEPPVPEPGTLWAERLAGALQALGTGMQAAARELRGEETKETE